MLQALAQRWAPLVIAQFRSVLPAASAFRSFHYLSTSRTTSLCPPTISQPFVDRITTSFLQPTTPLLEQTAGFKVKGRLRRRCKDCYFVMRQERLFVICKTHPRHKQMSMKKRDYKSWILTHATQSKVRPY